MQALCHPSSLPESMSLLQDAVKSIMLLLVLPIIHGMPDLCSSFRVKTLLSLLDHQRPCTSLQSPLVPLAQPFQGAVVSTKKSQEGRMPTGTCCFCHHPTSLCFRVKFMPPLNGQPLILQTRQCESAAFSPHGPEEADYRIQCIFAN